MNMLALGMMSGTSLDGVDLALCRFVKNNDQWQFEILASETFNYSSEWEQKLREAYKLNALDFLLLHNEYGRFIGTLTNTFLKDKPVPDLICSHGHTIFHQPDKSFTFQLGSGASIAASTGINTVSDFRTLDVALGGQGAPLVPIGDKFLFPEFEYCINLGGFANVSYDLENKRIAYDICPVNIVLNELASKKGQPFDQDGKIGATGKIDHSLLKSLNSVEYYTKSWPKSLGREWVEQNISPLLSNSGISIEDQAATFYEHIAYQIAKIVSSGKILFTGGGTNNNYIISKINEKTNGTIIIPDQNLINFKEALIFAFLGVLTYTSQVNCLSSVTGAKRDSIVGTIFPGNSPLI